METPQPTAARPAPGLLARLFPAALPARDLHRRRARAFGILAFVLLVLGFAFGKDEGIVFMVVMAAFFGARALWEVRALRRAGASEQAATRVDGLPVAQRAPALRRVMWVGGLGAAALSVWSGWGLWTVESGQAESAEVWGPVSLVYQHLGFWPAMVTCPALGVLIVTSARKKLREAEAAARAGARREA